MLKLSSELKETSQFNNSNVVSENSLFYILYYGNISENDDIEVNEQRLCGDIYRHYFNKHR